MATPLEIEILTKYLGAGAAQAIADQDKLRAATGELKKGTEASTEAAKEHTKHWEGSGRVFNQINKLVPELGHTLHAAFLGPLGPIILVGLALSQVKEKLKEYNEELDKVSEAEVEAHAETIKNLQDAWDNAQISFGKYQAALAHAGEDNDPIKTAIKREQELEDARIEGSKRLIERLGKEEEAAIRRNVALNGGNLEEQLRAAKDATQSKLDSLGAGKPAASLALMQTELDKRKGQSGSLATRETIAEKEAAEANEKFASHQEELKKLRQQKDDAVEKAAKKFEEAPAFASVYELGQEYVDSAKHELDQAIAERDNVKRRQAQLEQGTAPEAKSKAEADAALENARAANIENQKRIRELPAEMQHQQSVNLLQQNPNASVPSPLNVGSPMGEAAPGRTPYRLTPQGQARNDMGQLEGAFNILRGGGHLEGKQEQMIQSILTAATGQKVKHDKMLEALTKLNADNASRDAAFDKLVAAISRLKSNTDLQ